MHVLSGEIRKDPYTKEGNNGKGRWKMYGIELSERVRSRDGDTTYTNYRAILFANEKQIPYYDEWLSKGRFITVTSRQLTTRTFETNGGVGVSLEMVEPQLHTFQSSGGDSGNHSRTNQAQNQSKDKSQGQSNGAGRSNSNRQQPEAPMDFDDDIPF